MRQHISYAWRASPPPLSCRCRYVTYPPPPANYQCIGDTPNINLNALLKTQNMVLPEHGAMHSLVQYLQTLVSYWTTIFSILVCPLLSFRPTEIVAKIRIQLKNIQNKTNTFFSINKITVFLKLNSKFKVTNFLIHVVKICYINFK